MDHDERLDIWPVFGLRVYTPRLEMRPVDEQLAFELADLASRGIHDPDIMPFLVPWTDVEPPEQQRNSVRHYWMHWSNFTANDWSLPFAVFDRGTLVGVQGATAAEFPIARSFLTGSWLGRDYQGRGLGREMRAAILHLVFAGLGALEATTGAWSDNAPSLAVTGALGYEPNGQISRVRRGEAATELLFRMSREQWHKRRRDDITIDGLSPAALEMLGLAPDLTALPVEPT
jgi:RimJ/RimL family protein N-acetyltransferase